MALAVQFRPSRASYAGYGSSDDSGDGEKKGAQVAASIFDAVGSLVTAGGGIATTLLGAKTGRQQAMDQAALLQLQQQATAAQAQLIAQQQALQAQRQAAQQRTLLYVGAGVVGLLAVGGTGYLVARKRGLL